VIGKSKQQANQVLDALGSQTRRDILSILRQGPLPVGSIAEHLPISRPAVSKHLRILEQAGLVAYNSRGVSNIFYLRPVRFREARGYLEQFWDEALANFERAASDDGASAA